MGCCISHDNLDEKRKHDEIENLIKKDRLSQKNEIKMLLLGIVEVGAGESGKSTIFRQMKLIHNNGYDQCERDTYRNIISSNVVHSMKVILTAMNGLNISLGNEKNAAAADYITHLQLEIDQPVAPETFNHISSLWTDPGVQACFRRSAEYQLYDSAKYYFDQLDRISKPHYLPTDQDILRSRIKTTGIAETTFKEGNLTYRLLDVGGQRSERKKWIHCFENVTAILFLVAISEYDQTLDEDHSVNRVHEALTLFDSICNSGWFKKTSIILFLNKIDLFKEKLVSSPLRGSNYASACEYITKRFTALVQAANKQVYSHLTCATDTEQVKFVMAAVRDILVQKNLEECGLV
ncbi:guanine nucleotide binding protein, alpha subunit [Basidiobolus meristosporus CBS 931.73]|uniref:Guanine nucleotide binding protein, alpha subunit n=1 Tax=Basidiobolus meristosporus CBS 931.73 TaxID=1314790 RepID=A0A1Y1VYQ7_9FUNG|nr:guanine nucleotide binding protein, alpha subunit [Basidiobolus meristosporus CBS 931.73]|eukprot:ORX66399.1 guanine nucleotide binding protein, alpha subunit [Basidiobolus meristosporus CBS 931.73]